MKGTVFRKHPFRTAVVIVVALLVGWLWYVLDGADRFRTAQLARLSDQVATSELLVGSGLELIAEERSSAEVINDLLSMSNNVVERTYRTRGDPAEIAPKVIEAFQSEGWRLGETQCRPELRSGGGSDEVRAHTSVFFTAARSVNGWLAGGRIGIASATPIPIGEPLYTPGEEIDLDIEIYLFADPYSSGRTTTGLSSVYSGEPCSEKTCPDTLRLDCLNTGIWEG